MPSQAQQPSPKNAVLAAIVLFTGWATGPLAAQQEQTPDGVQQILPRGGIPAIDHPTFVSGAEAKIADDAWVLGVVVDGEAKAYSLNLLNQHEIVNDKIGDTAYAAVW